MRIDGRIPLTVTHLLLCWCDASSTSRWETSKIWPAPKAELYDTSNPRLRTLNGNSIDWVFDEKGTTSAEAHAIVETAQKRFIESLRKLVPPYPILDPTDQDAQTNVKIPGIRLRIDSDDIKLEYGIDESYIINIENGIDTNSSYIEIESITVYGALHALQTLLQLVDFGWVDSSENAPIFTISHTPLFIHDSPEYGYRGLLIDTSRHYLDVDLILTNLHVMAAHKLNVLHWHMVDSQSWPYVSSKYPELAEKGAFCRDCTYNTTQIQNIVQTAASLGIRVVIEIDLPGHSQAIGESHPEFLTSCFGTISEPLDVTKSEVQDFVKHIYAEVTQIFPDTWIHVGGDEVDMACWEDSTSINKYLKSNKNMDAIGLLNQFEQNLLGMVISDLNRRPIVWQELFDSNLQLPPETIVDIWKFWMEEPSLVGATAAGYDVIVSACWYLDYITDDWWKYHACNPRGFPLSAEQKQHILGGHASMWGEGIDGTNFFSTVWPRASSMAEVLWSGSPPVDHSMLSKEDVMDRLSKLRCSLLQRYNVPASPIQPDYSI